MSKLLIPYVGMLTYLRPNDKSQMSIVLQKPCAWSSLKLVSFSHWRRCLKTLFSTVFNLGGIYKHMKFIKIKPDTLVNTLVVSCDGLLCCTVGYANIPNTALVCMLTYLHNVHVLCLLLNPPPTTSS